MKRLLFLAVTVSVLFSLGIQRAAAQGGEVRYHPLSIKLKLLEQGEDSQKGELFIAKEGASEVDLLFIASNGTLTPGVILALRVECVDEEEVLAQIVAFNLLTCSIVAEVSSEENIAEHLVVATKNGMASQAIFLVEFDLKNLGGATSSIDDGKIYLIGNAKLDGICTTTAKVSGIGEVEITFDDGGGAQSFSTLISAAKIKAGSPLDCP